MATDADKYRHADEVAGSQRAAERIVPIVLELTGPIQSTVDVGGGTGAWLREFKRAGVTRLRLLDSETVAPELLVPRECLIPVNLERELPATERFDLAISLECAEHLSASRAAPLVKWLTSSADLVLFSAAVPGQGGKRHINEQPARYWSDLFAAQGFVQRDIIRGQILRDESIPWWYRQNVFLYVHKNRKLALDQADLLPSEFVLIHRNVEHQYRHPSLRQLLRTIPSAAAATILNRIQRLKQLL